MRRSGPPDRGTRQTTPCRAVSSSAPQQAEAGVGIKQVHHRFLNPKADSLTFLRPRTCWNKNVQPTIAQWKADQDLIAMKLDHIRDGGKGIRGSSIG